MPATVPCHRLRATGLALALCLVAAAARAEPRDTLHAFLVQTTSARGDFLQQSPTAAPGTPGKAGAKPVVSRGSFEFLRPGRFRWVTQSPYEQLVVSDGKTLYLYDKDLAQVTRKKLAGALPASPASILFGSNDFERDFAVENDGSAEGMEWIRAVPRSKDSVFEKIRIGFRDGLPAAMELRDSFGQATQLHFEHVQRNPSIAAAQFDYTPPPGVDVLEAP